MGDRIALLKDGRLVQAGTGEELYQKPVSLFAAGFFSELNVLSARVSGGAADTPLGRVPCASIPDGRQVEVAIRLSGFDLHEAHGEVPARVLSRRFLGVVEHLEMAVAGAEEPIRARVRCGVLPAGARDIFVSVRPSDVLVFETERENA